MPLRGSQAPSRGLPRSAGSGGLFGSGRGQGRRLRRRQAAPRPLDRCRCRRGRGPLHLTTIDLLSRRPSRSRSRPSIPCTFLAKSTTRTIFHRGNGAAPHATGADRSSAARPAPRGCHRHCTVLAIMASRRAARLAWRCQRGWACASRRSGRTARRVGARCSLGNLSGFLRARLGGTGRGLPSADLWHRYRIRRVFSLS